MRQRGWTAQALPPWVTSGPGRCHGARTRSRTAACLGFSGQQELKFRSRCIFVIFYLIFLPSVFAALVHFILAVMFNIYEKPPICWLSCSSLGGRQRHPELHYLPAHSPVLRRAVGLRHPLWDTQSTWAGSAEQKCQPKGANHKYMFRWFACLFIQGQVCLFVWWWCCVIA